MEEKSKCPMCGDLHNNCFVEKTEIEGKPFESYMCFQCGMTSNSYLSFDSEKLEEYTKDHSTLMNDLKIMDAATENKTVEKMYGKANRAVEFSEPSDVKPSPIVGPSTEPTVFAHITRLILSARS